MYMKAGTLRLLGGGVTKATTFVIKFEISNYMQMFLRYTRQTHLGGSRIVLATTTISRDLKTR